MRSIVLQDCCPGLHTFRSRWTTSFPLAFVISMLSGFVSRDALVNGMIIHSEMPSEKSSAIVTASEPLVHGEPVI